MCTTNINALEMDRQVFWQINYLHSSPTIEKNSKNPQKKNSETMNIKQFKNL